MRYQRTAEFQHSKNEARRLTVHTGNIFDAMFTSYRHIFLSGNKFDEMFTL